MDRWKLFPRIIEFKKIDLRQIESMKISPQVMAHIFFNFQYIPNFLNLLNSLKFSTFPNFLIFQTFEIFKICHFSKLSHFINFINFWSFRNLRTSSKVLNYPTFSRPPPLPLPAVRSFRRNAGVRILNTSVITKRVLIFWRPILDVTGSWTSTLHPENFNVFFSGTDCRKNYRTVKHTASQVTQFRENFQKIQNVKKFERFNRFW